jgi:short-subunit dehydrogenase
VVVGGSVAETEAADAEWIVDVNLMGVVHGCRAFLPVLSRQDEAHVVNVSSMMGAAVGVPKQALYGASKAAVRVFSESLWAEHAWGPVGVTVVLPGVIRTPILRRARFTNSAERAFVLAQVGERGASADALARAIVRAILRRRRRLVYGWDAWALVISSRVAPRLLATLVAALLRRIKV